MLKVIESHLCLFLRNETEKSSLCPISWDHHPIIISDVLAMIWTFKRLYFALLSGYFLFFSPMEYF